jgi:putative transcriptional regulator
MANYHPSDELLMEFTAGQKHDALGIMVACHLETCRECQKHSQVFEQVGGEILEETQDATLSNGLLDKLLSRLNEKQTEEKPIQGDARLPRPLRRHVPAYFDTLPWSGLTKNIKEFNLPFGDKRYVAKFYKIAAGKELPVHTHRGNEFTLVMSGQFSDDAGDYKQGDFILADTSIHHQPRASMDQDCICFAVLDAPLKFTGFFGRMLNPFLR